MHILRPLGEPEPGRIDEDRTAAEGHGPRTAVVSLYAWLTAVWFGAILFDVLYARRGGALPAEAADLLLGLWALVVLVAVAAIAAAWSWPSPRSFLLASVGIIGFEVLAPVVAAVAGWDGSIGSLEIGPWLRVAGSGAVTAFAFLALRRLPSEREPG